MTAAYLTTNKLGRDISIRRGVRIFLAFQDSMLLQPIQGNTNQLKIMETAVKV